MNLKTGVSKRKLLLVFILLLFAAMFSSLIYEPYDPNGMKVLPLSFKSTQTTIGAAHYRHDTFYELSKKSKLLLLVYLIYITLGILPFIQKHLSTRIPVQIKKLLLGPLKFGSKYLRYSMCNKFQTSYYT